ncbi:MAG: double zinc ribbon domain-containing protein [Candidatus Levyibacteriota bacterium]
MGFLDFVFPKKCVVCKKERNYICDNCFSFLSFDVKNTCFACKKPSINGLTHKKCLKDHTIDGCFSSLYLSKTTQKLIYSFKNKPYLTDLKKVLSDFFFEDLIQNEAFNYELKEIPKNKWTITYIPLHSSVFKKRGYNQAEILAKELGKRMGIRTESLLKKIINTKPQAKIKGKKGRRDNISGAFALNKSVAKLNSSNLNIFLVDDFVITGSTLLEAAKVLKKGKIKRVIGLTLAKS